MIYNRLITVDKSLLILKQFKAGWGYYDVVNNIPTNIADKAYYILGQTKTGTYEVLKDGKHNDTGQIYNTLQDFIQFYRDVM